MTVAELIAKREPEWRELEDLVRELDKPVFRRRVDPDTIARFLQLYRAVCSDLALSKSYNLPYDTVGRLNVLVRKAYGSLYRTTQRPNRSFWSVVLFEAPRWIITDSAFLFSFFLFWGVFLTCQLWAQIDPNFAPDLVGNGMLERLEDMYSDEFDGNVIDSFPSTFAYISHNAGIGLKCFVFGALGVIPGLWVLVSNASFLGACFGYMLGDVCPTTASMNFWEFTRAHGPFELTAIVLAAGAGLRIGWGFVSTGGYGRVEALRRAGVKASPMLFMGLLFFCFAAALEAFVSPNSMEWLSDYGATSYQVKLAIHWISVFLLCFYFLGLGGLSIYRKYKGEALESAMRRFLHDSFSLELPPNGTFQVGVSPASSVPYDRKKEPISR